MAANAVCTVCAVCAVANEWWVWLRILCVPCVPWWWAVAAHSMCAVCTVAAHCFYGALAGRQRQSPASSVRRSHAPSPGGERRKEGEGPVGRAHAYPGLFAPSQGIGGDGDKVTIEDVSLKIFLRDC